MDKHLADLTETLGKLIESADMMHYVSNEYKDPTEKMEAIDRWHDDLKMRMQEISHIKKNIKRCLKNQKAETKTN